MYLSQGPDATHTSKPVPMHTDDLAPQAWPAVAVTAITAGVLFEQAGWPTEALETAVTKTRRGPGRASGRGPASGVRRARIAVDLRASEPDEPHHAAAQICPYEP